MHQTLHAAKDGATKGEYDGENHVLDYLLNAFSGPGAAFMYAITALGALSLTIVIERMVLLLKWSAAGEGSPQAEVLAAGRAQTDADAAWDAMGGSAAAQEERIRRRIGALGAVANIATMLGLLGTVYGLILAFSALAFATLQRFGLYPPELRSTVLDFDFSYRRILPWLWRRLEAAGLALHRALWRLLEDGTAWAIRAAQRHHGPRGILARTWPSGSMAIWAAALLAGALVV